MPGWKLWLDPEQGARPARRGVPADRWLRPYRPGPLRLAVCLLVLALLMFATMVSMLAVYGSAAVLELGLRA